MIAGLGQLRLAPKDFWSMTLCELDAALRGHYDLGPAEAPFSRVTLAALCAAFPDEASR